MDSFPNLLDMTTQTHSGELFWGFIIWAPGVGEAPRITAEICSFCELEHYKQYSVRFGLFSHRSRTILLSDHKVHPTLLNNSCK